MPERPIVARNWPGAEGETAASSRDRFRHNLARLMSERGITQAGLARTMDVSRVAVHAWIWGTCFPETSRLIKLAQALGVSVGSLLDSGDAEAVHEHAEERSESNEEALLLSAFRKLPNTARLTLLAGAYELSVQVAAQAAVQAQRREMAAGLDAARTA